jgi:hypothetical protein
VTLGGFDEEGRKEKSDQRNRGGRGKREIFIGF